MRRLVSLAAALLFGACQPAPPPAPAPDATANAAPEAAAPAGTWLDADGAGETGLVYKEGADPISFTLSCRQEGALLVAAAPLGTLGADQVPSDVLIYLGATPVPAKSRIVSSAEPQVNAEAPLTPDVLKALAAAPNARIVMGETFVDAGADGAGKFAQLADSCAQLTGVSPAP